MFIKTFSKPDYPSDLELTDNTLDEIAYEDNHWAYMNRFPDYINSDTITSLVYETGDWYFYANDKYVDHYFILAFVNWSKMPVILSMCETEAEAQEQIKLLTIELNNK